MYRVVRTILLLFVVAAVWIPCLLYVALSLPWVQNRLRSVGEDILSTELATEVRIGSVDIAPFNRMRLRNVAIMDDFDSTALSVKSISARFELLHLLHTGKFVIDYVSVDGIDAKVYRKSPRGPLNISNTIRKLSSPKKDNKSTRFRLAISTVMISDANLHYNIYGTPRKNGFDANHLNITDLNATAYLPKLGNDSVNVELERLGFTEQNGLVVNNISADIRCVPGNISVKGLTVDMPHSHVVFAPIEYAYASRDFGKIMHESLYLPQHLGIYDGSYVTPSDLACFVPTLADYKSAIHMQLSARGSIDSLSVDTLHLGTGDNRLVLDIDGTVANLRTTSSIHLYDTHVRVFAVGEALAPILAGANMPATAIDAVRNAGIIDVKADVEGSTKNMCASAAVTSNIGNIDISATGTDLDNPKTTNILASVVLAGLDINAIVPTLPLSDIYANIDADISGLSSKQPYGHVAATIQQLTLHENTVADIVAEAEISSTAEIKAHVGIGPDSGIGTLYARISGLLDKVAPQLDAEITADKLNLGFFTQKDKWQNYNISGAVRAMLDGDINNNFTALADVRDIRLCPNTSDTDLPGLTVKRFRIEADNSTAQGQIDISGDFLNGNISGNIRPASIVAQSHAIAAQILPKFISMPRAGQWQKQPNDFAFDLTLDNTDRLTAFFGIPVGVIAPVNIDGRFDYPNRRIVASVDAPYLLQGDKIIEHTALQIVADGDSMQAKAYATTTMPTQKGPLTLVTTQHIADNIIRSDINWQIQREKPISGDMAFSTSLNRDDNGDAAVDVAISPGTITFGNEIWKISPAMIKYTRNNVCVTGFGLRADNQYIGIDGIASNDPDSKLSIYINKLQLLPIFETLDINKALIGGCATGIFIGKNLFGPTPEIVCDRLHVDDIGYNRCVIGTGEVKAWWDNSRKSFVLDAEITEPGGLKSYINGDIFVADQSIDLKFDARHVPVGFLKPFMSAFAADLSGHASGTARLYGSFKNIDLTGDLFAENLGLKIAFTNTWYYATDSVHIRPGEIKLKNITMRDTYGHTAMLNGYLKHNFFHDPVFDFRVTDADGLLVYDVTPRISPDWYGRVFGNGSATVSGAPGTVNIAVNVATTAGSTFTFVLSDTEEADEYTFISFRDKTPVTATDSLIATILLPEAVELFRKRQAEAAAAAEIPSAYSMDIRVDITPAASVNLVMDPVGGDEIKSNGKGSLRLTYNTPGNELHMYGTYTIERGSYNFTLQDIIVKDFVIDAGSSIAFTGDPYSATLDIKASYPVYANLSDLDESFLQDKDLARTNVPVNAVLMARGDMRQPDISFDLAFPTLNSDVYRKVRSIISTDEMMDRQIIYLLALNKFYTPEYMNATKGNELFSVASSTIAGQLSNILGKMSENWSIAPNLRSDRGDFSDVEVDVALSSSLLNNRLKLNGNFGYRDKSLNTNQFIGDFDAEYLLNNRGTWRLKAYNRYNDQNYYLRTAQTTQGIGVMFRRDFDNLFNFLKPKRKNNAGEATKTPSDSIRESN